MGSKGQESFPPLQWRARGSPPHGDDVNPVFAVVAAGRVGRGNRKELSGVSGRSLSLDPQVSTQPESCTDLSLQVPWLESASHDWFAGCDLAPCQYPCAHPSMAVGLLGACGGRPASGVCSASTFSGLWAPLRRPPSRSGIRPQSSLAILVPPIGSFSYSRIQGFTARILKEQFKSLRNIDHLLSVAPMMDWTKSSIIIDS